MLRFIFKIHIFDPSRTLAFIACELCVNIRACLISTHNGFIYCSFIKNSYLHTQVHVLPSDKLQIYKCHETPSVFFRFMIWPYIDQLFDLHDVELWFDHLTICGKSHIWPILWPILIINMITTNRLRFRIWLR